LDFRSNKTEKNLRDFYTVLRIRSMGFISSSAQSTHSRY